MERREQMKSGFAKFFLCAVLGAVLFNLPPDARVTSEGVPGQGWLQTGEMACSLMAAARQWEAFMGRQGWKKQHAFQMPNRRFVTVWNKNKHNVTLLLWEKEIGKSGFSWGESKNNEPVRK